MKPIIAHPEADEEFQREINYYESREEGLGGRFRAAVESAVERIQTHPSFFPVYEQTPCREAPVKRFPFAVYYLERSDYIWVVAFAEPAPPTRLLVESAQTVVVGAMAVDRGPGPYFERNDDPDLRSATSANTRGG